MVGYGGIWWGMVGSCSASSHNFRGLNVDRPGSQGSPPSPIFTPHSHRLWVSQFLIEIFLGKPVAEIAGRLQTACRRAGQLHGEASVSMEAKASHLVEFHASSR